MRGWKVGFWWGGEGLHKIGGDDAGDCTHYCSTPFLWAPLWRSVRLGVEYRDARLRPAVMG